MSEKRWQLIFELTKINHRACVMTGVMMAEVY